MARLLDWWGKLTGKAVVPAEPPARRARPPRPAPGAAGLELADDRPPDHPSRVGESGFDPYSSDAGHTKPHSWERVDHD